MIESILNVALESARVACGLKPSTRHQRSAMDCQLGNGISGSDHSSVKVLHRSQMGKISSWAEQMQGSDSETSPSKSGPLQELYDEQSGVQQVWTPPQKFQQLGKPPWSAGRRDSTSKRGYR